MSPLSFESIVFIVALRLACLILAVVVSSVLSCSLFPLSDMVLISRGVVLVMSSIDISRWEGSADLGCPLGHTIDTRSAAMLAVRCELTNPDVVSNTSGVLV